MKRLEAIQSRLENLKPGESLRIPMGPTYTKLKDGSLVLEETPNPEPVPGNNFTGEDPWILYVFGWLAVIYIFALVCFKLADYVTHQ